MPAGTTITLEKLPLLSVWVLPVGVTVVVPNWKTRTVLAAKPVPLIAILVPGGPEVELRASRVGVATPVTVKVVLADAPPAVAVMEWAPAAALEGMVIIDTKRPVLRVAASPEVMIMAVVSN